MSETLAEQLEALAAKATPGPWRQGDRLAPCSIYEADRRDVSAIALAVRAGTRTDDEGASNAALIVALRNNLPAIIAALRTTDHHDEAEAYRNRAERAEQALAERDAEIVRLREALGRCRRIVVHVVNAALGGTDANNTGENQ